MMAKNKNKKTASKKTKFPKDVPTLQLKKESDIAMDFATKAYRKFDKLVKSVVLFGSTAKQTTVTGSDIDIIILLDDVSVNWDEELIAWYRKELEKIIKANPYQQNLHINTVKLSTWWEDFNKTIRNVHVLNPAGAVEIVQQAPGDDLKSLLLR